MLIQIADPAGIFAEPKFGFRDRYQFEFLDAERDDDFVEEFKISLKQAKQLVNILKHSLDNQMNVIVQCNAGLCRSGAICEVGVMMGFEDTLVPRIPNLLVKSSMMKILGYGY